MPSSSFSFSTSITLIRRAQRLEPEAWTVITRLYGPLVYGWSRKSGLQGADAADLVQDVFLSVWRGLPKFSIDRPNATFRGWLLIITKNALNLRVRRNAGSVPTNHELESIPDPETETSSSGEVDEVAYSGVLRRAQEIVRDSVDESTWNSFWQVTVENRAVEDVAQESGMTPQAVRQAKYRVLCRLRSLIAND